MCVATYDILTMQVNSQLHIVYSTTATNMTSLETDTFP